MGRAFGIHIVGIGENGCDTAALPGERLFHRCKRLDCIDCRTLDFVQLLRQQGYLIGLAEFTHDHGTATPVVDDILKNTRKSGAFTPPTQGEQDHGRE